MLSLMRIFSFSNKNGTTTEFMDRFTAGAGCTNQVYSVKEALGASKLDCRGFMNDFINKAQGRNAGFLDRPMLWMTHHQILDKQGWENKVLQSTSTSYF